MPASKNIRVMILALLITVLLVIIPIFTQKIFFADTTDYLGVARYFHGDLKSVIRNTHSWDYGLFMSIFLNIWNSIIFLRFINAMWFILISIVLYRLHKDLKILFLWFLSPIVWYMAPYIHPLPMSSFFVTYSYYFLKKYEQKESKKHLAISGFLLGISAVFWDGMLVLSIFFALAFFYNKKLNEVIYFILFFMLSFSIKPITDYVLFNFPLFSVFRQLGSGLLFFLKKAYFSEADHFNYKIIVNYFIIFVSISPLFFITYKYFRKNMEYKPEIFFILLILLFHFINGQLRYMLIIAPIAIFLISKVISKKELIVNICISIFLIGYLTYPAFAYTLDTKITEDLVRIERDFPNGSFIAGSSTKGYEDDYLVFSTLYYGDSIKEFISWQDYNLAIKNETIFYQVKFKPDYNKINELRNMFIVLGMSRANNRSYSEVSYLISREKETELENFELLREYEVLNVFKKI